MSGVIKIVKNFYEILFSIFMGASSHCTKNVEVPTLCR